MDKIRDYEAMAKLDLPLPERQWASEMADMLTESFKALEQVDTAGADPLVTVLEVVNVLREDVSAKLIPRDELLSGAPEQYDGYFQAPKTLD